MQNDRHERRAPRHHGGSVRKHPTTSEKVLQDSRKARGMEFAVVENGSVWSLGAARAVAGGTL
jgi:hypothetical protein